MLVYGAPGIGKTSEIGFFGPDAVIVRPPLDHTQPLLKLPKAKQPKEIVVSDWATMLEVGDMMRHEGDKFDWWWLDSISLFQDQGLDDIWSEVIADKPHRAKYGADKGEYGVNMFRLGQWVRHAVSIPGFNFGIIGHPAENDAEGKLMPWVQGKQMPQKICACMNVVGFMEVKDRSAGDGQYRVINFRPTEEFYAKDQLGAGGKDGHVSWINQGEGMSKIMENIAAGRVAPARNGQTRRRRRREQ